MVVYEECTFDALLEFSMVLICSAVLHGTVDFSTIIFEFFAI